MIRSKAMTLALLVGALIGLTLGTTANAAPAPDANSVLILDITVTGGAASLEAMKAAAAGHTVVVVGTVTWLGMSAADFASYRALVLGDATCPGVGTSPWLDAPIANRGTWGPVVNGNVIGIGTDPVFHNTYGSPGGGTLVENGVKFAADEPTKTGYYGDLSCYYHDAAPGTPVPILDPFGLFTVTGVGCYNDTHIVAVHPVLVGLTDAATSGWSCSVHEAFDSHPSDFIPLVIARDPAGGPPLPGSKCFADGSCGVPYILVRGEKVSPILCGNTTIEPPEECDDGNTVSGDGCSAACKKEKPAGPVCGNKITEPPEQCDDGNTVSGDGCSATCKTENKPPICTTAAASVGVLWPPNHKMVNVSIDGVGDPEGGPVDVVIMNVMQDEPTNGLGDGDTAPDAVIHAGAVVELRAERAGTKKVPGDGRVYHVSFMATDSAGDVCAGEVTVCVPHDMGVGKPSGKLCVDGGPLYDSTQ